MRESDDMHELIQDYINDVVGLNIKINEALIELNLPVYLKSGYVLYEAEFMEESIIFVVTKRTEEQSLNVIKKQLKQLERYIGQYAYMVYVCPKMSGYGRRSLIKERIPFVVVGTELYMPFLGMAFKKRSDYRYDKYLSNIYKSKFKSSFDRPNFTPTAQALLIDVITHGSSGKTQSDIAKKLGFLRLLFHEDLNYLKS